ncbi:MAG: response regulator [Chlamydiota bacterium]|nr:response regulator [Chlamydiota bacterium]
MTNRSKVIVIDGDNDLQHVLMYAFKSHDIDYHGYTSGKEALEHIDCSFEMASTSLIVLERRLPDMDGIVILDEVFKRYRSSLPVLILSEFSSDGDIIEGLQRGAVEYVSKPFNLEVFLQRVHALVRWQREK